MLLEFQSGFCAAELLRGTTAGRGCRSPADSRHRQPSLSAASAPWGRERST